MCTCMHIDVCAKLRLCKRSVWVRLYECDFVRVCDYYYVKQFPSIIIIVYV